MVALEPGQLEDDAVDGGQRGDRAAALPVPGPAADGADGHVEVERDRGRGQQAERTDDADIRALAVEEAASGQGVGGVVQGVQRVGVRLGVLGGAGRAEAVLERAATGAGGLGDVEGQRGAAGLLGQQAELGQRQRHAARQSLEGAGGRGGGVARSTVGMCSQSREGDGQPVLVARLRIGVYVIHNVNELKMKPANTDFCVVISGHSHKPLIATKDGILFINPGSAGPRRFKLPISVARLKIQREKPQAKIVEIKI